MTDGIEGQEIPITPDTEQTARKDNDSSISQEKILKHLQGTEPLKGRPEDFPTTLDLGILEGEIRGLREQHIEGFAHTEDDRKRLLEEGHDPEWVNRKVAEAEVARTIYFDRQTGKVEYFDSTDHHESSVSVRSDGRLLGNAPLLDLHTHPAESLPSIQDFFPLIEGLPELQRRVHRGIMILNPDTQVLALATDATPLLKPVDAAALINDWMQQAADAAQESAAPHVKRIDTVRNALVGRIQKQLDSYIEASRNHVDKLISASKRGEDVTGIDGEEADAAEELAIKRDKTLERGRRLLEKPKRRHQDAMSRSFTETQLQFVKQMGIKLYRATDFRHFEAVDA